MQPPPLSSSSNLALAVLAVAERHGDRPVLHHRGAEEWAHWTGAELADRVRALSRSLVQLGLQPGDRLAILAENCPHWIVTDLACLGIGVVDVPIYATSPAPEVLHVLRDSGSRAVVVSNAEQFAKVDGLREQLPELQHLACIEPLSEHPEVPTLEFWIDQGRPLDPAPAEARAAAVGRDDLASILYTSGTTGEPKGVMLSHGNFLSNCEAILEHIEISAEDRTLSFLPLSHCFERTAGHYTILLGGGEIAYATDLERVAVELKEIQPTVVMGVPRFYEKMQARVQGAVEHSPYWRRKLFRLAMRVGQRVFELQQRGEELPSGTRWRWELAQKLVFQKLRDRIGGRVRLLVSGGAPLAADTSAFFNHAGLGLVEGYGLTETSPVISCNTPTHNRPGSVGRPIPGVEVRIADDGEILVRGPGVMRGYWRRDEETREVLDEDGTFHTGDIGQLDDDGFLAITDRKKEIIVSAGGKNVSPARVEELLKQSSAIADVCLIGDRQRFLVALMVPDFPLLKRLVAERGLDWTGRHEMLKHPVVAALFQDAVRAANEQLAPPERVRRFALLAEPFSQENRQLTPTLKVRRKVIAKDYETLIGALYQPEPEPGGPAPILQMA